MFRNLIHVESNYAWAHSLPQRLNVFAVPWISLLRHSRRTNLSCSKVFKNFTNFRTLKVAKVISKVSNNSECNIHLQKKTKNVFRFNKLVRIFRRLKTKEFSVNAFKFFRIFNNHTWTVVRTNRTCKLTNKVITQFFNFKDRFSKARNKFSNAPSKSNRNSMLTVSTTNLWSSAFAFCNFAKIFFKLLQFRKHNIFCNIAHTAA